MKALILSEITSDYIEKISSVCEVTMAGACKGKPELSRDEFASLMEDINPDILLVDSTPASGEILARAKSLKMVSCTRGNPVNVDKNWLDEHSIPLTTTPARNANSVAEFTLALIISCLRNIPAAAASVRKGDTSLDKSPEDVAREQKDVIWYHPELKKIPYDAFQGKEMVTSTLGLLGLGAIGRNIAAKATALGMKVIAYDPFIPEESWKDLPAAPADLEMLARESDVLTLHAKATNDTFHLIGKEFLGKMKPTASVINTSRGSLIDTKALVDAVKEQKLAGAALDVFEYEPLSLRDEILSLDSIMITPHIGGASGDVASHHSRMAWEAVDAFLKGDELPYLAH